LRVLSIEVGEEFDLLLVSAEVDRRIYHLQGQPRNRSNIAEEKDMAEKPTNAEVETVRQDQHTGNHNKPGPEAGGSDRHGGTRHGAENVEPTSSDRSEKGHQKPS
jgi:hypothetical protein